MPTPMTPRQMDVFTQAAQMGMACGLEHPWEWLSNALRMGDIVPYAEWPTIKAGYIDAFLAFWHNCGSHPYDPCETANEADLFIEIERYYEEGRRSHESGTT